MVSSVACLQTRPLRHRNTTGFVSFLLLQRTHLSPDEFLYLRVVIHMCNHIYNRYFPTHPPLHSFASSIYVFSFNCWVFHVQSLVRWFMLCTLVIELYWLYYFKKFRLDVLVLHYIYVPYYYTRTSLQRWVQQSAYLPRIMPVCHLIGFHPRFTRLKYMSL